MLWAGNVLLLGSLSSSPVLGPESAARAVRTAIDADGRAIVALSDSPAR